MKPIGTNLWITWAIFSVAVSADDNRIQNAVTFGPEERGKPRVTSGKPVKITEYPYLVSLRLYGAHRGGASLLAADWVLTAAHALVDYRINYTIDFTYLPAEDLSALMGADDVRGLDLPNGAQIIQAYALFGHPEYQRFNKHPDIGLLRLVKSFLLGPRVNIATMPTPPMKIIPPENFTNCKVIGWGLTDKHKRGDPVTAIMPDSLMMGEVVMLSNEECSKIFPLYDSEICSGVNKSGGKDACQGDSGGPLVCNGTQVAIISWGYGCGWDNMAGVYSRVDCQLEWLIDVKTTEEAKDFIGSSGWWLMIVLMLTLALLLGAVIGYIIYTYVKVPSTE